LDIEIIQHQLSIYLNSESKYILEEFDWILPIELEKIRNTCEEISNNIVEYILNHLLKQQQIQQLNYKEMFFTENHSYPMIFLIGSCFKTNYLVEINKQKFNYQYQTLFKKSFVPELTFIDKSSSSASRHGAVVYLQEDKVKENYLKEIRKRNI